MVSVIATYAVSYGICCANSETGQTQLTVFAETTSMRMAGMPDISGLSKQLSDMAIPGTEANPMLSGPRKKMRVRLWSPSIAPKDAVAELFIPAGLKLGEKLALEIYRPKDGDMPDSTKDSGDDYTSEKLSKCTIKYYWGSGEKVKEGQPMILKWDDIPENQKMEIMKQADMVVSKKQSPLFYRPNWSTGYWPTEKGKSGVGKDAKMQGTYRLSTNYAGNTSVSVPENVNFLEAFVLTSPGLQQIPSFDKVINFKWNPIQNLVGSQAMIIGITGEDEITIWSSSEIQTMEVVFSEYPETDEVKRMVDEKIFMPPSQTEVTVPEKIFTGCNSVFMMMNGYGNGVLTNDGSIISKVRAKTNLMVMLKGM